MAKNKRNAKSFIIRLAGLLLENDKSSADWTENPVLLRWWEILFISGLTYYLLQSVFYITPLYTMAQGSEKLSFVYRIIDLTYLIYISILLFIFAYKYYLHTLDSSRQVYFTNILFFYVFGVAIFSGIYFLLFNLIPSSFIIHNITYSSSLKLQPVTVEKWKTILDFILFSAFQIIGGNYFRIQSNSVIVSIMTYIQSLYTMSLLTLFISAFVNQKTK